MEKKICRPKGVFDIYTFLIESRPVKNGLIPSQDFGYAVIEAVEFNNWWDGEKNYDYRLINMDMFRNNNIVIADYLTKNHIPVGSVEFVLDFMRLFYGIKKTDVKPLNVPMELIDFTNREIWYLKSSDFNKYLSPDKEYFIKSATVIKGHSEILTKERFELVPKDTYLVSEFIDIKSEWRAFVKSGDLLDIKCYSGDSFIMPSVQAIREMIKVYKSSPPAYTIDVCVDSENRTSIIECHNFFSCGLYGFNDPVNYVKMLIRAFYWQIEKSKGEVCWVPKDILLG